MQGDQPVGNIPQPPQQTPPPTPGYTPPQPPAPTVPAQAPPAQPYYGPPAGQSPYELPQQSVADTAEQGVSWTASEFISYEKNAGWYLLLTLAAAILAAAIYFLTKDKTSAAVIVVGAVFFGVYAARPPRQLTYHLDQHGLTIGNKSFSYQEFRSFAIMQDGPFQNIVFMPLKRFMPLTTIYFAPEDEQRIVDTLALNLPVQEYRYDVIDRLMKFIRF